MGPPKIQFMIGDSTLANNGITIKVLNGDRHAETTILVQKILLYNRNHLKHVKADAGFYNRLIALQ
jgi:hypothetical protein